MAASSREWAHSWSIAHISRRTTSYMAYTRVLEPCHVALNSRTCLTCTMLYSTVFFARMCAKIICTVKNVSTIRQIYFRRMEITRTRSWEFCAESRRERVQKLDRITLPLPSFLLAHKVRHLRLLSMQAKHSRDISCLRQTYTSSLQII